MISSCWWENLQACWVKPRTLDTPTGNEWGCIMGRKLALVIGNTNYADSRFSTLSTPAEDVHSLTELLKDPAIGSFDDLEPLINQSESVVSRTVEKFFSGKMRDDLLLFYFSGHGMLDEEGQLYLALADTDWEAPRSSALSAEFVRGAMDRTRSQRVVLILDCCHSGAFARGQKSAIGGSVGTKAAFEPENGFGRWVLTATDATQYAWEGNKLVGPDTETSRTSVFTRYLVQGLHSGEADLDHDGLVSVRDLSEYVYDQVVKQQLKQTPSLWTYKEQGNLFIASNPKPVLPPELMDAIQSPYPNVRLEAVQQLIHLTESPHEGVVRQAKNALKGLIGDDSRKVAKAAARALGTTTSSNRIPTTPIPEAPPLGIKKDGGTAQEEHVELKGEVGGSDQVEHQTTPKPPIFVRENNSWLDDLKKSIRRASLSAEKSLQASQSRMQKFFAQAKLAVRQHKALIIRIEISLAVLITAGISWQLAP